MAGELTSPSYLAIEGEPIIYFTDANDVAGVGEADGTPIAFTVPDRGKRETRRRQMRISLANADGEVRMGITSIPVGRVGSIITIRFASMPFGLYPLFKTSNNSDKRGVLHLVHQVDTEDLAVEWWRGLEWQDLPDEYSGDPLANFDIILACHGNAA